MSTRQSWLTRRLGTEMGVSRPRVCLFCVTCGSRIPWRALWCHWWERTACPSRESYEKVMTTPQPRPTELPTETILRDYHPGDNGYEWADKWAELIFSSPGTLGSLILDTSINKVPGSVLLGDDMRVRDGHEQLFVALLLGIATLPVVHVRTDNPGGEE